jgi:hypothetical protein
VVERKGPVKYWAAPLLLSLTAPALAIGHDWFLVDAWQRTGTIPHALLSLVFNILLVGSFSLFFAAMYPDSCPRCGHRSLIPLLRLWGACQRTSQTRWCGSCGAKYWRNREGIWQKERRATWVDAMASDSMPIQDDTGSGMKTGAGCTETRSLRYPAPRATSSRLPRPGTGSSVRTD